MEAGKLKHLITIDEPAGMQDDTGDEVVGFVPFVNERASIEPLSGREGLLANSITATADTRINFYWSPNLDPMTAKWRVRHGPGCGCGTTTETIYNLAAPPKILEMRNREIELLVSSGANRG